MNQTSINNSVHVLFVVVFYIFQFVVFIFYFFIFIFLVSFLHFVVFVIIFVVLFSIVFLFKKNCFHVLLALSQKKLIDPLMSQYKQPSQKQIPSVFLT